MAKKSGKSAAKQAPAKADSRKIAGKRSSVERATLTPARPRRFKPGRYKTLRLQQRIKHPVKLPNAGKLTVATARVLRQHKRLFIGITLVYGLLNLVLVQGLAAGSTDVNTLKSTLNQVFTGHFGSLASSLSIFAVLVGSAGNGSSPTAGAYQLFLGLITSLLLSGR